MQTEIVAAEVRKMQIGEVAAKAGVKTQTIRFYERRGLLREPMRTASGYRAYPSSVVRIVRFILQRGRTIKTSNRTGEIKLP